MIGTTVSHYRILQKVGEGGMGEVYLADDTKLHRKVALKFLTEELTRDDERKQRFIQEARSAAGIQHPHIAAIYDVDEVEGRTFIAMEYVPGESLRNLIRSKTLSYQRCLELGLQIAEGLAKAHEKGVVHRDVKPENVLISEDGYAKIIDFGLAKLVERATSGAESVDPGEAETLLKTREGMVMGTVAYMSPEQALGEKLDPRTDIFSLGAVLYEMLSGTPPFGRRSAVGTLSALLKESPPELTLPESATPVGLQQVLAKALAKERTERYQSMKDLVRDLKKLRDGSSSVSQPPAAAASASGARKLWAAASLAFAVLLATVFYLSFHESSLPGIGASGRPAIAVVHFENMSGDEEIRWLSRGLPNMLVTDLAQTPGLDVVSSYRLEEILKQVGEEDLEDIDKSMVADIARRAGAGAVVVGSIFKSGDEIRIDVQLEDSNNGRILSAQSVRGADVFPLVDELTGRIRASLQVEEPPERRHLAEITTTSLEAYQLYSQGLEASRQIRLVDAREFLEKAVELDPSFALAHMELSNIARDLGQPELTQQYLEKALQSQAKLPERHRLQLQAMRTHDGGDYQGTVELFERLVSLYPDSEDAYVYLWHNYGHLQDPQKRLAALERGVRAIPTSGQLHNQLGNVLLGAGRYRDGIRELETYASLHPDEANPYDSLGDAYILGGQPQEALDRFTHALKIDPSFYPAYAGRAWVYGMLGRFDEALQETETFSGLLTSEGIPNNDDDFMIAFLLSRTGRYREAEARLSRGDQGASPGGVRDPGAHLALLSALLAIERQNYPQALEMVTRAERLLPQVHAELTTDRTLLVHLFAGVAEASSGNLDGAREHLEAMEELELDGESKNWWRHALGGEIALAEGDVAAAEEAFTRGEPSLKMGTTDRATQGVFANSLPFRDGLARVTEERGDLAGAIEMYRRLNRPDIGNKWTAIFEPRYVLQTARLLDQMGDEDAARAEYQRFLELWKNADEGLPELVEARSYVGDE